jgi:hypothetical protein
VLGHLAEHIVAVLGLERDANDPPRRGDEQQGSDRAVHGGDRHIDEPLGFGALEKPAAQSLVDGHRSPLLSFFRPSCTLWRAESCVVDIAAAISG